jgi:mono/diheme cytochrome c family protein
MVALASLIAFFVIVALVVVAAAFAGGRRRRGQGGPSRGADRLLYTGLAIVIVGIGLGVPLMLLIGNADADRDAVGGVDLTAATAHGRQLFAENCGTCHTLAASDSAGAIGPNLDVMRPQAALVENAILVGRAAGRGNMPAGLLSGEDAKDVSAFVEAVAGRGDISSQTPAAAEPTP